MESENGLAAIIREMRSAVEADLGVVALAMGVAIPAICASLAMADGRSGGEDYKTWCQENLRPGKGFDLITDEELYSLRCGMQHQGRSAILNNRKGKLSVMPGTHSRVVFAVTPPGFEIEDNSLHGEYLYSVRDFCARMAGAALAWYERERGDPVVIKNLDAMVRYRPLKMQAIVIDPPLRAIY